MKSSNPEKKTLPIYWKVLLLLVTAMVVIFPLIIAIDSAEITTLIIIVFIMTLVCLWVFIIELLIISLSFMYNVKIIKGIFIGFYFDIYGTPEDNIELKKWKHKSIPIGIIAYIFTVYNFAIAYMFLSKHNVLAFNKSNMDFITSLYFSFVTSATVGFGDIYPISNGAKILVIFEVLLSLLYVIFFFSIISSVVLSTINKDK